MRCAVVVDTTVLTHIAMPLELRDQVQVYARRNDLLFADAVGELVRRGLGNPKEEVDAASDR